MRWENRIVRHTIEDPGQLLANPFNHRIHTMRQKAIMEGTLDVVGWIDEVIVNETTDHVVNGHMRMDLALKNGEPVPVRWVRLTEDEERLALATYDPIAQLAVREQTILNEIIADIDLGNEAVRGYLSELSTREDPGNLEFEQHIRKGGRGQIEAATGAQLLLSWSHEDHAEAMSILDALRDATETETNSEAILALLRDWWALATGERSDEPEVVEVG